jgi:methionine sulfoxide reductase catalytic subunit
MNKQRFLISQIPSSEITPKEVYLNRRRFMQTAAVTGAALLLNACAPTSTSTPSTSTSTPASGIVDELGDAATPLDRVTHYNNFYEFSFDKEAVANLSSSFTTNPWQVEVNGLVNKPKTFGLEEIQKNFTQEERIYRLRCVEGWSMVIPWSGFSLADLLKQVEPKKDAQYVSFETVSRPDQMPGQKLDLYPWPYTEGLRLDEAMHPLATLATGLYGEDLLPANGAPIRLVVPWKYGFKSIKSIVKITLTDKIPPTFWNSIAPDEYGFYSNVNPYHPHPRWSQDSERRIGELQRRLTLMFNGYEDQVKNLYSDMDLNKEY